MRYQPGFKDFNERKEKRIPNEYQLVQVLKERISALGLRVKDHNFRRGFDIVYESHPGITVGIEIKSIMNKSDLYKAIGQCVYRLGKGEADEAMVYSNFSIPNMQEVQEYIDKFQLPIKLQSIENIDGEPYLIPEDEISKWIKVG